MWNISRNVLALGLIACLLPSLSWAADVLLTADGAVGDGVTDDTTNVQTTLTTCSTNGDRCVVPSGKTFKITNRLFMWGAGSLYAETKTDGLTFDGTGTNLVNFGLSAMNVSADVWTGTVSHMTFTVTGGAGGRILFFWRTNGATVTDNIFTVGATAYSATSSGNNQPYLNDCEANAYSATNPCVRRNITITNNLITGTGTDLGSEGFGLGHFDGAIIDNNDVRAVGDDPIALHFCTNSRVTNNRVSSLDGRVFIVNSRNVLVASNRISRTPRVSTGTFYAGIALLYIGFEDTATNSYSAPTNITVHNNKLIYPVGAIDSGAAIYLYGLRSSYVANNRIYNDSSTLTAQGIYLLPFPFVGVWTDPDGIDPTTVGRVHDNLIENNSTTHGMVSRPMIMTGNCADHVGTLGLRNNQALSFSFYCGFANIGAYQSTSGDPAATRAVRN